MRRHGRAVYLCAALALIIAPTASADPTTDARGHLSKPPGWLQRNAAVPGKASILGSGSSLLPLSDGTDIASLATGAPVARPLAEQLQLLFEAFFSRAAQGSTHDVQLQVSYSYSLAPDLGPAGQVAVAFVPWHPFAVPADWSPGTPCQESQEAFVCQVTQVIRQWFQDHQPTGDDAQLTFDLAGTPSGSTLPPVRVSGLIAAPRGHLRPLSPRTSRRLPGAAHRHIVTRWSTSRPASCTCSTARSCGRSSSPAWVRALPC